jgi:hypothetical protein
MLTIHRELPTLKRYIADYAPKEIFTLDHPGPYFFELPNLKSITKPELPPLLLDADRRVIIISPIVKSYPLWSSPQ